MIDLSTNSWVRHLTPAVLLAGILILGYAVVKPFIVPVAWAGIIGFATWPLYARLRRSMGERHTLAALLMTALLATAFVLPSIWLVGLLRTELTAAYALASGWLAERPDPVPDALERLPWIGPWLADALSNVAWDPVAVRAEVLEWVRRSSSDLLDVLGSVGRNTAKLGMALITVFFIYRDGELLLYQVDRVLHRLVGRRIDGYLSAVGGMTKAVVWGLVLTAIAQGAVAGLGYWWADLEAPVLLGVITALIAMVPFGTPFAWGSIGIWLLISGDTWHGIGLLLWGGLVVSWVDNLVRPLVISNVTRIPFLLVMFGVLGGLAAFGLVGLFVGPVILAVLMAVWREWIAEAELMRTAEDSTIQTALDEATVDETSVDKPRQPRN